MPETIMVKPPQPSQEGSDVALAILMALARLRVPLTFETLVAVTEQDGRAVRAALIGLLERRRLICQRQADGTASYRLPPRKGAAC